MFELTAKEQDKLNIWMATKDLLIYTGTIGGRFTYQFTPTSLGVIVKVLDGLDKTEIDLTDYSDF